MEYFDAIFGWILKVIWRNFDGNFDGYIISTEFGWILKVIWRNFDDIFGGIWRKLAEFRRDFWRNLAEIGGIWLYFNGYLTEFGEILVLFLSFFVHFYDEEWCWNWDVDFLPSRNEEGENLRSIISK